MATRALSMAQVLGLRAVAAGRVNHRAPDIWVVGFQDVDVLPPAVLTALLREHLIAIVTADVQYRPVALTAAGLAALRGAGGGAGRGG